MIRRKKLNEDGDIDARSVDQMIAEQGFVEFEVLCSNCGTPEMLRTTMAKRTTEDKETIKRARTAFRCSNCDTHNELEITKDLGVDFEW